MTPKEQYEADLAKFKDMDYHLEQRTSQVMMLDAFDRFVTAAERIADALERQNETALTIATAIRA